MSARYRRIAAFVFGCGMIAMFAPAARAQQATPLPKDFDKVKGEFESIAGNGMICVLNGNRMFVRFDKKSKVYVTGTATVDALEKGMFVKFSATLDRHGKGTEPIKALVIFTPDADHPVGVILTGSGPTNAFEESNPTKKKGPPPLISMYDVAGRILVIHNNLLTVDCDGKKVRVEVAPDATVKLDATDPFWASSGDIITIKGSVDQPPHGVVLAENVYIKLANPLVSRRKGHGTKVVDKVVDKTTKSTDKTAKGDAATAKADPKVADPKAGDSKTTDSKAADSKSTDSKTTDSKAADSKAGGSKPADKSTAKGTNKGTDPKKPGDATAATK
jgi:hypothetical protein